MAATNRKKALEAWRRKVKGELKAADESFKGKYADELNDLLGLSKEDIDRITPDTSDLQAYHQLITLVEMASRQNVAQAELRSQIRTLGTTAMEIAKKVPRLAALLA